MRERERRAWITLALAFGIYLTWWGFKGLWS